MKNFLPFFAITILAAACNTNPEMKTATSQAVPTTISQPDTTGMAEFNAWKAQNELANVNAYKQTQQTQSNPAEKTTTIVKYVPVKTSQSKSVSHTSTTSTSSKNTTDGSGSMNNESSQTAQVEKKKGWSKAAKGAVIGGVAGAAGGAIINKKNPVVGAVIGGVIGAAGGYGIGHGMDKKDGRIDYNIFN